MFCNATIFNKKNKVLKILKKLNKLKILKLNCIQKFREENCYLLTCYYSAGINAKIFKFEN